MTPSETAQVLLLVQAYTNRTVGKADVAAWQLVVGDLDQADCQAAVVAHYTRSTEWLMPAQVRGLVKAVRRDRLERAGELTPPHADPDDVPGYLAALREQRRAVAAGEWTPPVEQIDHDRRRVLERAVSGVFRAVPQL